MIDYEFFDLFNADSTDKQFYIEYLGGAIANEELFSESIEISESLCSESSLRFGCCEASSLKFKVGNVYNLPAGMELTVSVVLSEDKNDPFIDSARISDKFVIGKYYVDSSVLTADKMWREVTAYDALYKVINEDVAVWYNAVLPNDSSNIPLHDFRSSFATNFGLQEVLPEGGLVNDDMTVTRTIAPEQISGRDVLTAICEINGCFGHIGRDGKLHYIYLDRYTQGLYPSDDLYPDHAPDNLLQSKTGHLYPQDPKYVNIGQHKNYVKLEYEDFVTKEITKLQIRDSENAAGTLYPSGAMSDSDNCYTIQGNFLVYGKSDAEMQRIAERIYGKITGIIYRPFDLEVRANPCAEVGDSVRVSTDFHIVESYIMQRTMKGLQAFMDTISASGTEKYTENVNSVQSAIEQLKGKTNTLTRTSEETRSELTDLENSTESKFVQTAERIETEVMRAQGAENELSSRISQTSAEIQMEVSARQGDIADVRANLSLKIDKTDDGTIISLIEGSADRIHFNANNMFTVTSPHFSIDETGKMDIGGNITANTALYLAYQLFSQSSPHPVDALNVQLGTYAEYSAWGERPYTIIRSQSHGSLLTPILNLGDGAAVIKTSKQFQPESIYSDVGMFADCVMTNANIASLWLMATTDGTYGGTVYECNGSYGNEGIASPGWVKKWAQAQGYATTDESGYVSKASYSLSAGNASYADVADKCGNATTNSHTANCFITDAMRIYKVPSGSARRFKTDINPVIDARLDPRRLYNIDVVQFKYKPSFYNLPDETDMQTVIGMIADDIDQIYPCACEYDEETGEVINWLERYMIPPMLALIQEQHADIELLKQENLALKNRLSILEQRMEELLNAINQQNNQP